MKIQNLTFLKNFSPPQAVVVLFIIFSLIFSNFLPFFGFNPFSSNIADAVTYTFVQTDWSGSASSTQYASHSSNRTGWTNYATSTTGIDLGTAGEAKLSRTPGTTSQTSDTDFNAGTNSSTTVVDTGTGAYLRLTDDAPDPGFSVTNPSGTATSTGVAACSAGQDHAGADWTISSNTTDTDGDHCNVGTFTVNSGVTLYSIDGTALRVFATTVDIQGTIDTNSRGSNKGTGDGGSGSGTGGGTGSSSISGGGGAHGGSGGAAEAGGELHKAPPMAPILSQ